MHVHLLFIFSVILQAVDYFLLSLQGRKQGGKTSDLPLSAELGCGVRARSSESLCSVPSEPFMMTLNPA